MLRRRVFRLPGHPASVHLARLRVRDHMSAWGHGVGSGAVDDALLLVSELATNAVRHGLVLDREFEVAVTVLADGSCLIEVSDGSPAGPELRGAAVGVGWDAEHGRGLQLVDVLAQAWGVWQRGRYGKTVWVLVGGAESG
ncbi:ATP-binding protein [Streptomyces sp. NBC_01304]|uniref:ATP-binding protein n=1 Tax=Streptomyces sp. NBC_01304 TaxID=2903818 RepID=UPI002E12BEDD|nr:ATP-binding protein [Streptomyces sp. NBC_01304]